MSTAQAVTPGQGQTVNIAGVEVGEIASVKLRDGKAIIGMRIQPEVLAALQGRVGPAAAEDRPEGHGRRAHAGHQGRGPAGGGRRDPDLADAARRQPRRDPRGAGLRHARLPACCCSTTAPQGLGSEQKGRELAQAIRRLEPTAKYAREINEGLAVRRPQPRARRAQLLAADRRARQAATRSSRTSCRTPTRSSTRWPARTRRCGRSCRSCRGRWTTTQATLGKVTTLADVLGPTLEALRPAARALGPSLRQTRPFLRESTPIIRDEIRPFTRAALPTVKELRPAMRDLAAATPGPDGVLQRRQPAAQHGRLQPAGRQGGGLPLLAVVGQPRRQRDLLHAGRARPDPPRPGRAVVLDRAAAGRGRRRPTRSSARSSSCSTRRRRQQICPQSTAPAGSGGTTGG